jgi:hypothetical protein
MFLGQTGKSKRSKNLPIGKQRHGDIGTRAIPGERLAILLRLGRKIGDAGKMKGPAAFHLLPRPRHIHPGHHAGGNFRPSGLLPDMGHDQLAFGAFELPEAAAVEPEFQNHRLLRLHDDPVNALEIRVEETRAEFIQKLLDAWFRFVRGAGHRVQSIFTSPARHARWISSETEEHPVLRITRPRWVLMVFSAAPSSAAICLLSMPVTTSLSTSVSRGVSKATFSLASWT